MAYRRLGRTAEARRELFSATDEITSYLGPAPTHPEQWFRRVRLQLLRREAEALILDPDFPANPFAR